MLRLQKYGDVEMIKYCFFCDKKTERDKKENCIVCGAKDLQIGRKSD